MRLLGTSAVVAAFLLPLRPALWVGYEAAAVSLLRHNQIQPYNMDDLEDVNTGAPGAGQDEYYVGWQNSASEYQLFPPPGSVWTRDGTNTWLYPTTDGDRVKLTGDERYLWQEGATAVYAFSTYLSGMTIGTDYPSFSIDRYGELLWGALPLAAAAS